MLVFVFNLLYDIKHDFRYQMILKRLLIGISPLSLLYKLVLWSVIQTLRMLVYIYIYIKS